MPTEPPCPTAPPTTTASAPSRLTTAANPVPLTASADSRRDNPLWLQLWRDADTDFHQLHVNPLLTRFWPALQLARGSRVFVPLCGKSLDMLWLAQQGYQVIGVELSPIAVKAFFKENGLKPARQRVGNFMRWQAGAITLWCGDFFSLDAGQLGQIDTVYDRAALTALPEDIRAGYVRQLRGIVAPQTEVFLLTVEDIDPASEQAREPVDAELLQLYGSHFAIALTHAEVLDTAAADGLRADPAAVSQALGKVYRLVPHSPL